MATQLNAVTRPVGGKGNARSTRRDGNVPAVIYGNKESPLLIALDKNKLTPHTLKAGFLTHVMELSIDGKTHRVLPRDVQFDVVTDQPLHVDFLRVTDKTEIRVQIPVSFTGSDKAPGIKRGGLLNVVSHEIGFYALAGSIPESIEIDVAGMEIGDSIHLAQVTLPKGLRLIDPKESEMTIVTVAPPTTEAEPAPTAEAAAPAAPAKGGKTAAKPAAAAAPAAPAKKK